SSAPSTTSANSSPAPHDPALDSRTGEATRQPPTCPADAPKPSRPGPGRPPGRKNTRPTPRHDVHTVRKPDTTKPKTKKSTTPRPRRGGRAGDVASVGEVAVA
ncbi:hypothetical protein ACFVFP_41680, partial [Streptomyces sp. NPDC057686]